MLTNFVDKNTTISAAWLNQVDQLVNSAGNAGLTYVGAATDVANVHLTRNATYAGGAPGFVNSGLRVDSFISPGVTAFEWAITGVVHNSATGGGQNVGVYGQGNMLSTGATWGAVAEATDGTFTGSAGKQGLVGQEVDAYINGADTASNRVALQVVVGDASFNRGQGAGSAGHISNGILLVSQAGGTIQTMSTGVNMSAKCDGTAFACNAAGGGLLIGYSVQCPVQVGFDTSLATVTNAAIRVASGQVIAFDAASVNQFFFDGSRLRYDTVAASVHTQQFSVAPNGYTSIGPVVNNGSAALFTSTTNMVGANEQSALFNDTFNGTGTNAGVAINSNIATGVASTTYEGLLVFNPTLIGGASISGICVGLQINALSSGAGGNQAISLNNAAGANNYNIYAPTAAQNFMGGPLGWNGAAPPAQVTGFGTPVGGAVIANYNITDAGGANSNTNKLLAEIATIMKAHGMIGN